MAGLEGKPLQLRNVRREALNKKYKEEHSKKTVPGCLNIKVSRELLLEQSLQSLCSVPSADLLAMHLSIKYKGEEGIDIGGVSRDWFDGIGRVLLEAAESGQGHFMVLSDKTLFPRPYETRFKDLLAIGRLAGLALWFGIALPIPFGSVILKLLLDEPISPRDLQRLDPDFYQFRVEPVLKPGGVEALEAALCEPLMFVSAATELRTPKDLCESGSQRRVTEQNKKEYIRLLCQHYLYGDMQEQIKVFLQGFRDICPKDDLITLGVTYRELALLITGYSKLDPADWRRHTQIFTGFKGPDCGLLIEWFWEMVGDMSDEERAKLMHFTTGSSRLPAAGVSGLHPQFNIAFQGDEVDHHPTSHTCGNMLVLPRYLSKKMLVEKMNTALANDEGFGFA